MSFTTWAFRLANLRRQSPVQKAAGSKIKPSLPTRCTDEATQSVCQSKRFNRNHLANSRLSFSDALCIHQLDVVSLSAPSRWRFTILQRATCTIPVCYATDTAWLRYPSFLLSLRMQVAVKLSPSNAIQCVSCNPSKNTT